MNCAGCNNSDQVVGRLKERHINIDLTGSNVYLCETCEKMFIEASPNDKSQG